MQRDRSRRRNSRAWRPISGPRKLTGLASNLDGVFEGLTAEVVKAVQDVKGVEAVPYPEPPGAVPLEHLDNLDHLDDLIWASIPRYLDP